MKTRKNFLYALLSLLSVSVLIGCKPQGIPVTSTGEEPIDKPLEIGDTVKEWCSKADYELLPMDVSEGGTGLREIATNFGSNDDQSLHFEVKGSSNGEGYIGTDLVEEPYFIEDDAKNGDIISASVYLPKDNNLKSIELGLQPFNGNSTQIKGTKIEVTTEKEEKWMRLEGSFDTLETLGGIRIKYSAINKDQPVKFFVDDINIVLGEETKHTDYDYKGESLSETYEEYFKVGACMSSSQLHNTENRKIAKHNFNSLTAENEAKPQYVLDQKACQAGLTKGKDFVAITMEPFEKLYNFCEASHIGVRHHTFVWYSQTPDWFFTEDYTANGKLASKDLMLKRMENFIQVTLDSINDRWPELVYGVDVSNEAIDNGIRKSNNKWYDTVGEDFVYYAFKYADKYKAEWQDLYYNDYSFDYNESNCEFALNTLLKDVIKEDLIDGVGIQGHIDVDNIQHLINDAKMIYQKGLKCQITELDITVNSDSKEDLAKQEKAYKNLIMNVLESNEKQETDINAVIVWGFTDDTSWKRGQNPLLFTSTFKKKPAYYGFLNALDEYLYGPIE